MKHVAAYLLAVLGGNASPSADDVKKILSSVGIEANDESLTQFLGQVEGKNVNELIEAGRSKLSAMPAGGAGGAAPADGAAAGGDAPAAEEAKEEEPAEESEEDMGFSLFD